MQQGGTKNMIIKSMVGVLAAFGILTASAADAEACRAGRRQAHQQARIGEGVRSGELTRPEARRLEREQRHIRRAERRVRADGEVTAGESARLDRMQDRASRRIYREKHDRQERW
jgi:hypothetical protein